MKSMWECWNETTTSVILQDSGGRSSICVKVDFVYLLWKETDVILNMCTFNLSLVYS